MSAPPHIFREEMKPLCDLCNSRHESYQAHVFASNAASNRTASNNVRVDGAEEKEKEFVSGAGVSGCKDDRGSVLDEKSGDGLVQPDRLVKQRWSREAYNAYQREYMRRRRARA